MAFGVVIGALGAVGTFVIAFLIFCFGKQYILQSISSGMKKGTLKIIAVVGIVWMIAIPVSAGWIVLGAEAPTGEVGIVDAEYDVAVSESHSYASVNEESNSITVLLDRNATTWESGTENLNLSFTITRIDAGTSDSTVVFDVTNVESWIETDGTTRTTLQKYSNGEYYADWNEYGSSATVNDKISILIDRETESNAIANISAVADLSSWLLESQGQSHTVTIALSDTGADWTSTWTIAYILSDTS